MENIALRPEAMCEGSVRPATITERLKQKQQRLQDELNRVNEAVTALEENPRLQKLFDVIARA